MRDFEVIADRFQIEALCRKYSEYSERPRRSTWTGSRRCSPATARGGPPMAVTPACRQKRDTVRHTTNRSQSR